MADILARPALRPLYAGVFALHFIMTATFLSVPQVLALDLGIAGGRPLEGLSRRVRRVARGHDPADPGDRAQRARAGCCSWPRSCWSRAAQALLGLDHLHLWRVLGGTDAVLRGLQLPRGAAAGAAHAGGARARPGRGARRVRHVPSSSAPSRRRARRRAARAGSACPGSSGAARRWRAAWALVACTGGQRPVISARKRLILRFRRGAPVP